MPTLKDLINAQKELDYKFTYGKHKGKTIEEVLYDDPGYIIWASESITKFNPTAKILQMARDLINLDPGSDIRLDI